ncbi:tRNA (adenosine(37)-N6)-threonylcarbamoyltransferase complex transferase subunit TsaD [Candidatus Oleimmundimicrobium sp.]|uniref:tRNA (adenosine(37)-N6)-threonylcarbamoyltransferase complex transferase subunit TsaD n=1 Tax=Candidatus Oleimmundimicrobium sp. TaxID=3060597 RepID=UPI0027171CD7|nr:tRNA (adenosine(37)-N6)-threonylcarbamoyltransferase complex transferase subunit TsaD [Candidatus Oleimmundimicrobium sp.]MDO8886008.1 tRNA (adenosine(37)-N6)-threonylcarbamoyltransferase complex transferase subunit TsaD [Candidatus Oleimmundimicrobium sp.]
MNNTDLSQETLILGIETSCDETAAAVVADGKRILSNIIASQVKWHQKFNGVVPEIASRKHVELISPVIEEALLEANVTLDDIDAIAVTRGPGLVGALLVGLGVAKGLSYATKLPLICVNHIEAHILANFLEHPNLKPPLIALVVSGGHTALVYMGDFGEYEVLGETLDDAAGEAFDKIAKFLGLGYPGGPIIDKLAAKGNSKAINFPRAMINTNNYDFSLSGLKTAVLNYISKLKAEGKEVNIPDLCASFQAAVIDVQIHKTLRAARERTVDEIVLAGGVAANKSLRERLKKEAAKIGKELFYSSLPLCTDNAAMIACVGYYRYRKADKYGEEIVCSLDANADPNLSLVKEI